MLNNFSQKPSPAYIKATKAFGYIGVVLSGIGFFGQIPIVYQIIENQRATCTSVAPALVSFTNCLCLAWYGMPFVTSNNEALLTVNCIGAVIMLLVISTSLWYRTNQLRKIVMLWLFSLLVLVGVLTTITMIYKGNQRKATVGVVAMISNLSVSLIPLVILVRMSRDRTPLPIPIVGVYFFSLTAMVWAVYGELAHDIYIVVPSCVGFVVTFHWGLPHICWHCARWLLEDERERLHRGALVNIMFS